MALVLETLYHQAESVSPWGYDRAQVTEPVALDERDAEERGARAVPHRERDDELGERPREREAQHSKMAEMLRRWVLNWP
jgi:hypothetical protein